MVSPSYNPCGTRLTASFGDLVMILHSHSAAAVCKTLTNHQNSRKPANCAGYSLETASPKLVTKTHSLLPQEELFRLLPAIN